MARQDQKTVDEVKSEPAQRHRERWEEDMEAALAGIRDGAGYDGDEVLAWLESWGSDREMPRPGLSRTPFDTPMPLDPEHT